MSKPPMQEDLYNAKWIERVLARCIPNERGCLIWQGGTNTRGYAQTNYRSTTTRIHRKMYELTRGVILDKGILVCHSCDERLCCEKSHFWAGTPKQNSIDMADKRRQRWQRHTHCQRGHELVGADVLVLYRAGRPIRKCQACQRGSHRIRAGWPANEAYSVPLLRQGSRTERRKFDHMKKRSE